MKVSLESPEFQRHLNENQAASDGGFFRSSVVPTVNHPIALSRLRMFNGKPKATARPWSGTVAFGLPLNAIPFNEGDSVGSLQLGRWHKPLACGHAEHRPEAYATETLASFERYCR